MGKGGPLAFLNKKGWHPGNLRNMEEVWKREQAAAKEEKKIKEMQKKLEEEREKEEIQQLAERAGHVMQSQRLDWMYQGGVAAKEDAERRQEEHLLGKAPDLDARNEPEAKSQMERVTEGAGDETVGGTGRGPLELSSTEQWSRMNDDPLFMVGSGQVQDEWESNRCSQQLSQQPAALFCEAERKLEAHWKPNAIRLAITCQSITMRNLQQLQELHSQATTSNR